MRKLQKQMKSKYKYNVNIKSTACKPGWCVFLLVRCECQIPTLKFLCQINVELLKMTKCVIIKPKVNVNRKHCAFVKLFILLTYYFSVCLAKCYSL